MITPNQIAANLNRILEARGSTQRITPTSYEKLNRETSRTLETFTEYTVKLARDFEGEGNSRIRGFHAKETLATIRPMPGGGIRLLLGICVLKDNAQEGVDFDFLTDEDTQPLVFACSTCDATVSFGPSKYYPSPRLHPKNFWSAVHERGWRNKKGAILCPAHSGVKFLRNKTNGRYFAHSRWVEGPADADVFSDAQKRKLITGQNYMFNQYIGKWDDTLYEFVIPQA